MFEPNQEYKRGQIRDGLGLTVISKENTERTPNRSREAAKMGMNILLVALALACWWCLFDLSALPYAGTLGMIYALCFIITKPENENEI